MTPSEYQGLKVGQDAILRELVDFRQESRKVDADHETRLRVIEKWKWQGAGIATVLASAVAAGCAVIL